MSDFQVSVGVDFSEVLKGFASMETEAKQAGQAIGKGIDEGVTKADQSVAGLLAQIKAIKATQATLDVDSSEYTEAQQKVTALEKQITALDQQKISIDADANTIDGLKTKLAGLQAELGKVAIGSERFRELQGEIDKTEKELNDATGGAQGLEGILSGGLAAGIAGVVAGFASISAIGGLFKNAFDQAVEFETITKKLANTLGEQGAAGALAFTKDLANELGLSYKILSDSFGSFTAAATASGVPLQEQKDLFAAVAKSSQALGLSNEELSGSLLALQQVASKGVVQMEELRGQLGERLPVAFGATAKGLGITQQELIKLVESGKLTSEQFFGALTKGLNELNAGATGLPTTQQNLDKLNNAWTEFGITVGGGLKSALNPLIIALTEVGKGFTFVAQALADAPAPVQALIGALTGIPAAYTAARLAAIAFNSELVTDKIKLAQDTIDKIGTLLKTKFIEDVAAAKAAWLAFKASIETGQLQQQITDLATKFGPLALAAGGVAAAFASYNASTADSRKIAEEAAEGQLKLTQALADAGLKTGELTTLGGPFARAWQDSSNAVEGFLGFLKNIPVVGDLVAGALRPLVEGLAALAKNFTEAWSNANATQGLENAAIALNNLQTQSTLAQNAAAKLVAELKNTGVPPNPQQIEQIEKLAQSLIIARDQSIKLRETYELLAAAARQSGNEELARQYDALAKSADANVKLSDVQLKQLGALLPANQKITAATKEQEAAIKERAKAEAELNKIIDQAPVRKLDADLAVGQQLLNLSQAIAEREQSRFNVVKAGLQFELETLEKRGAGEAAIAAKKAQIDQVERQALAARYQALLEQQRLEESLLRINQEKAKIEVDLSVKEAELKLLEAKAKLTGLSKNATQEEKDAAVAQVKLQAAILGITQDKRDVVNKIQPLERAIAEANGETARNGLRAEAAAKGYRFAADGSLVATGGLANSLARVSTLSSASLDAQNKFRQLAEQSGFAIGKAADGTLVMGRTQREVNAAVNDLNRQLGFTEDKYDDAAGSAGDVSDASSDIGDRLSEAEDPARNIEGSFTSTGDKAPRIVQGARDFAAYLSSAKLFVERIDSLDLATAYRSVADAMGDAAAEAKVFYDWLYKAAGLPAARWSGGPVEAGGEYKVNELGQEAFLSAGRLSLINAPSNSIWRAPSSGVVVPAGITTRLQDQGAIPVAAGGPVGVAELAVEVGKLRQEVAGLARKDWSIHVQQRTGPTASQVMNQIHRLR